MPDYLSVVDVKPAVDDLDRGDGDHTLDTLLAHVEASCADWDEPVRLLFTSPWEPGEYGLLVVEDGEIEQAFNEFSLSPQALVAVGAERSPRASA